MDSENSSLNPSSILDLKAELHKKYESFQRAKLSQNSSSKPTTFKYKGQAVPKLKKVVPKVVPKLQETNSEEDLALKKSQLALEAKTKLYEKITSSNILIDDEENEKYLVDFHRKVLYAPMPEKTQGNEKSFSDSNENQNSATSQSSKAFREIYMETPANPKENDKSEENQSGQPIHYQNIQFNEVRDHGTGYFAFSMDESERKEQMEELNKLRQQTEEQILVAQRLQRKRKAVLEARLAKVCERRNIDKNLIHSHTKSEGNSENSIEEQVADLSSIPLPKTPEVVEKKEVKVRPWDVGKTNFPQFVPEKHKIRSQNDWIKERRSERPSEFAPPSAYQ